MQITLTNQQHALSIEEHRLVSATRPVLSDAGFSEGALSIAIVDDPTIHQLNVEFLQHDYATDVLSFVLEEKGDWLEGEIIASADTAVTNAADYSWPAEHELLLYVIHGALHLVGYRDKTEEDAAAMRTAEAKYLRLAGVEPPAVAGAVATVKEKLEEKLDAKLDAKTHATPNGATP